VAEQRDWLAYIDTEVRAACMVKGLAPQVRRKWSARDKPVSDSNVEDYEWKLIPRSQQVQSTASPDDFEGVYYVLRLDRLNRAFVLQHDTSHCGVMGPHWEVATYSEIRTPGPSREVVFGDPAGLSDTPPAGWLRDHLVDLVTRFDPNHFSST
jgi:hypothetical protein